MPRRKLTTAERADIIDAYRETPSIQRIADARGLPRSTVQQIVSIAKARGMIPDPRVGDIPHNSGRKPDMTGRNRVEVSRNVPNRP